ncbi:DUF6207 family protein [Streptomyces albicerus]
MRPAATAEATRRDPGRPGVRLHLYADLRQGLPRPDLSCERSDPSPRGE